MAWLVILSFILVGFIFLLMEMLIVPGTTFIGFIGAAMMAFGVYSSFVSYGTVAGTYTLAATLVISIAALALALKSNTWKKAMLATVLMNTDAEKIEQKVKPGDEGVTISRLNPMGKAMINEEYFEVSSKDNLIDPDTRIIVVKVDGNKIIVKSKTN
jgi:membrane-bound ClpP family serine protease